MVKARFLGSVAVVSLVISACTQQQAAEIVYKGSDFFGREYEGNTDSADNQTFSADAPKYKPGYARPVEPAQVPVVAVSDLPPPAAVKSSASAHTLAKQEPSSGGKAEQVLKLKDEKVATLVEVKEQQVASLSEDIKPAHKEDVAEVKEHPKFIWPVDGGKVIAKFKPVAGNTKDKGNDGINIAMGEGEPIFAAAAGTVVYAGNELKGYGNMVIVRHADGWMTAYAHARSLNTKKGEKVKQGALIAYVGTTGGVKVPQVHFAMRKGKTPVDPVKYLPNA